MILLSLMIFVTFGIQIAICYQRDGFRIEIDPLRNNTTLCKADENVVITLVLDLFLIGSYWFGIYLFSGQGDSEHLFSLVSRVGYHGNIIRQLLLRYCRSSDCGQVLRVG